MPSYVWTGAIDTAAENKLNWTPNLTADDTLADADTCIWNQDGTKACSGFDFSVANPNEVGVTCIIEESYKFTVGGAGDPFQTNGFDYVSFKGAGTGTSYFESGGAAGNDDGFDNVVVDSPSKGEPCLNLAGTIARLVNERGKTDIQTGATVSGRLQVLGATSGDKSVVAVAAGCTLTGLFIAVDGGLLELSTTGIEVRQSGGELVLAAAAGISTRYEQSGGQCWWDAASTIALAELSGGRFGIRSSKLGRVLTASAVCGNAEMDIRIGGLDVTFTNNPVRYGNAKILRPSGLTMTGSGGSEGFPW